MSAETQISWRTYQRLTSRQASEYNAARFTPTEDRTHKQETVLFDIRAQETKRTARVRNVNVAVGKVHTSSGEHYRSGNGR